MRGLFGISVLTVLTTGCGQDMGVLGAWDGTQMEMARGTAGSLDWMEDEETHTLFLSTRNERWDCDGLDPTFQDRTGFLLVASLYGTDCQVMRWDASGPFGGGSGGSEYWGTCDVDWAVDGDRLVGSLVAEGDFAGSLDFDVPDCGPEGFRHQGPV